MPATVCRALIVALSLGLAVFFGFVGWNKAFAALPDLARYGSWTIYLPEWLGRLVGFSEMTFALGLLAGLMPGRRAYARYSALALIGNQLCAAAVHAVHGEASALPQNAVLMVLLGLVGWGVRANSHEDEGKVR